MISDQPYWSYWLNQWLVVVHCWNANSSAKSLALGICLKVGPPQFQWIIKIILIKWPLNGIPIFRHTNISMVAFCFAHPSIHFSRRFDVAIEFLSIWRQLNPSSDSGWRLQMEAAAWSDDTSTFVAVHCWRRPLVISHRSSCLIAI